MISKYVFARYMIGIARLLNGGIVLSERKLAIVNCAHGACDNKLLENKQLENTRVVKASKITSRTSKEP